MDVHPTHRHWEAPPLVRIDRHWTFVRVAPAPTGRTSGGSGSGQRLPSRVPAVELVPPGDLVLAELPAQVDLLAVQDRWEIDQSTLDVLDDDARSLDGE